MSARYGQKGPRAPPKEGGNKTASVNGNLEENRTKVLSDHEILSRPLLSQPRKKEKCLTLRDLNGYPVHWTFTTKKWGT